jgi:signal transduction histidine kinase
VGLVNMRNRIGAVSGELEINSAPGQGHDRERSRPTRASRNRFRDNIVGATVVTPTSAAR